jgi:hypothetical protein
MGGGISKDLCENATACAYSKGFAESTTSAPLVLWTGPAHCTTWFVLPETEDGESTPRSGQEISPGALGLVPATAHLERSAAQPPLPCAPYTCAPHPSCVPRRSATAPPRQKRTSKCGRTRACHLSAFRKLAEARPRALPLRTTLTRRTAMCFLTSPIQLQARVACMFANWEVERAPSSLSGSSAARCSRISCPFFCGGVGRRGADIYLVAVACMQWTGRIRVSEG